MEQRVVDQQIQNIKLIQFNYLINKDQDAIFFEEIFCNQEATKHIQPITEVKSTVEDIHLFNSTVISENKKGVNSSTYKEISLTPEELAEFKNFDKTLEEERTQK